MDFKEQERIQEMKNKKYLEQKGLCAGCKLPFKFGEVQELAHVLPQRKWVVGMYGKEVVHHELNMKLTHTGLCNSMVQISPNKTKLVDELIEEIQQALLNG